MDTRTSPFRARITQLREVLAREGIAPAGPVACAAVHVRGADVRFAVGDVVVEPPREWVQAEALKGNATKTLWKLRKSTGSVMPAANCSTPTARGQRRTCTWKAMINIVGGSTARC